MKMLMKKTTRPISIILAIVMILSSLTVGITAWAADSNKESADQPALKDRIESLLKEGDSRTQKEQWAEYETYFKGTLNFIDPNMMLWSAGDTAMGKSGRIKKTETMEYMAKIILENYDFLYETFITLPNSRSDTTQPGGRYWTQSANYTVFDNDQYAISRLLRIYGMLLLDWTKFDWKYVGNNNDTAIKYIISDQMDLLNDALKKELANGNYTDKNGNAIAEANVLAGANRNKDDYTSADAAVEKNITKRMLMLFNGDNKKGSGHLLEDGGNGSQNTGVPFLFVVYDLNDYKTAKDIPNNLQPVAVMRNQNRNQNGNNNMDHNNTGFFGSYFGAIDASYNTKPNLKTMFSGFDTAFTKESLAEADVSKTISAKDMRKVEKAAKTALAEFNASKIDPKIILSYFGDRVGADKDFFAEATSLSKRLTDYVAQHPELPEELYEDMFKTWGYVDAKYYMTMNGGHAPDKASDYMDKTWDRMADLILENYDFLFDTFVTKMPGEYWKNQANFTVTDNSRYTIAQLLRMYYAQYLYFYTITTNWNKGDGNLASRFIAWATINPLYSKLESKIGDGYTTKNGTVVKKDDVFAEYTKNYYNQPDGNEKNGIVSANANVVQRMLLLFNGFFNNSTSTLDKNDQYDKNWDFTVNAPSDYSYLTYYPTVADIPDTGVQTSAILRNRNDRGGSMWTGYKYYVSEGNTGLFSNYFGTSGPMSKAPDTTSKTTLNNFANFFTKDFLNITSLSDLTGDEIRKIATQGKAVLDAVDVLGKTVVDHFYANMYKSGSTFDRAHWLFNEASTFVNNAPTEFNRIVTEAWNAYSDDVKPELEEADLEILADWLKSAKAYYDVLDEGQKGDATTQDNYAKYGTLNAKLQRSEEGIYTEKYNEAIDALISKLKNQYVLENLFENPAQDDDLNGTMSDVLATYFEAAQKAFILSEINGTNVNTAKLLGEAVWESILLKADPQDLLDWKMLEAIDLFSNAGTAVPDQGIFNSTMEIQRNPLLYTYNSISDVPENYAYKHAVITYRYKDGKIIDRSNIQFTTEDAVNNTAYGDFNLWQSTLNKLMAADLKTCTIEEIVQARKDIGDAFSALAKYTQRTKGHLLKAPDVTEAQAKARLADVQNVIADLYIAKVDALIADYGKLIADKAMTDRDIFVFSNRLNEVNDCYTKIDSNYQTRSDVVDAVNRLNVVLADFQTYRLVMYRNEAKKFDDYYNKDENGNNTSPVEINTSNAGELQEIINNIIGTGKGADHVKGLYDYLNATQKAEQDVIDYQNIISVFQTLIDDAFRKAGNEAWKEVTVDYSHMPNVTKEKLENSMDGIDDLINALAPTLLGLSEGETLGDYAMSTIDDLLCGKAAMTDIAGNPVLGADGQPIVTYNGDNVINSLMQMLYPMLYNILRDQYDAQGVVDVPASGTQDIKVAIDKKGGIETATGLNARPKQIAGTTVFTGGMSSGAKYNDIQNELKKAGDLEKNQYDRRAWEKVNWENMKWLDYSKDSNGKPITTTDEFFNALGAALAPAWKLLQTILYDVNIMATVQVKGLGIVNIDVSVPAMAGRKGLSNILIPLYKQLGCTDENLIVDGINASNYSQMESEGKDWTKADKNMKHLITPLLRRVKDIANSPMNSLTKILPTLAYVANYNPSYDFNETENKWNMDSENQLLKGLKTVLGGIGMNPSDLLPFDLGNVNKLIEGFMPKDADGFPIFNVPYMNFGEISGIAKKTGNGYAPSNWQEKTVQDSLGGLSGMNLYDGYYAMRKGITLESKQDEMLVYLLRLIIDTVKSNPDVLSGVIDTLPENIKGIVNTVLSQDNDTIINALIGFLNPDPIEDVNWDMSGWDWESNEAKYPADGSVNAESVAAALGKLDVAVNKILTEFMGSDIKSLIKENLFTEQNLNDLIMTVYRALDETIVIPEDLPNGVKESTLVGTLRLIGIDLSNEVLASAIESVSPDAAAKIRAVDKYTDLDLTDAKWKVDVTDSDNFAVALAKAFKPFNPLLNTLLNGSDFRIFDSFDIAGANGYNNTILPILNALGCKDVLTADDYKKAVNGDDETSTPGNEDALLASILIPLFDSLNEIAENPTSEIATRLPNIANFLDNNGLSKAVFELVLPITNFIDPIFKLVSGKTETTVPEIIDFALETLGIELEGIDINDLEASIVPTVNGFLNELQVGGVPLSLQLPNIDWGKLAGHGTQKTGSSFGEKVKNFFRGAQPKDYRIEGDKGDTAMAVLNYVFDAVKLNKDSVIPLIEGALGTDENIKNFAVTIINKLLDNPSENISAALIKTINADNPADVDWNAYDFLWSFSQAMYPEKITADRADKAIATVDSAIKNALWQFLNTDANKLVSGMLYTDANLKAIVEALYGALAGQDQILDLLGITLPSIESLKLNGSTRDGFVKGLSNAIAPFAPVLEVLLSDGNFELLNGGFTLKGANGYKNSIIPMLYAFGCTEEDIMSPSDYKNAIKDGKKDVLVSAIINPILNTLERILKNPVSEITGMLPNFAYFMSNGGFTKALDALILPITNIADPALSLVTGDSLLTFAFDTLGDLAGISIPVDPDNIEDSIVPLVNGILSISGIAIEIPEIDWAKLAGCGELKSRSNPLVAALSGSGKSVMNRYVQANKADAFIEIMRYVVGIVYYKNNPTTIKNLVANIVNQAAEGENGTDLSIINEIVSNILASNDNEMIAMIIKILVPDTTKAYANWTYPVVPKTIPTGYTPNLTRDDFVEGLSVIDTNLMGLVSSFAGIDSLLPLLSDNLYTPGMIGTIAKAIFGSLNAETLGVDIIPILQEVGIDLSPLGLGKNLVESRYKSVSNTLRSAETWKDVDFNSLDWGFKKGDRDGFVQALVALLRPMEDVLAYVLAGEDLVVLDSLRFTGGEGYNNAIIPLLEAFGCSGILSAKEYKENGAKNKDALLLNILNPLFDKIESILAKPVNSLTEMLPNIALFMANNGVKQLADSIILPITDVLNTIAPVYKVNLDLSILEDMDVTKMVNDLLAGMDIGIKLIPISFTTIAGRGEAKMVESLRVDASGARVKVPVVEADKPAVLVSVLRYIVEVIKVPENLAIISKLVEGDPSIGSLVGGLLGSIFDQPTDTTVELLMQLLAGIMFEEDNDSSITLPKNNVNTPTVVAPGNVTTVPPVTNGNGSNGNNGKAPEQNQEKKKNYVPLIVAGSVAAVIIPAGAAGYYIYRKRKMSVSSNVI